VSQDFVGLTALITGSTSGIGRAVAEQLAARGAHVIVSGRDKALGDNAAVGARRRWLRDGVSRPSYVVNFGTVASRPVRRCHAGNRSFEIDERVRATRSFAPKCTFGRYAPLCPPMPSWSTSRQKSMS
jgi:NAD(P)-dependent dehydrogenase (short-subunit alcohol dehydrogenase family)